MFLYANMDDVLLGVVEEGGRGLGFLRGVDHEGLGGRRNVVMNNLRGFYNLYK